MLVSHLYADDAPAQAVLADGIPIRRDNIHDKVIIIDGVSVATGSANYSMAADRNNENSIWIDDATVSRRHACIAVSDSGAELRDLGSKNGTCVDDLDISGSAKLDDGDRIRFGRVRARFVLSPSGRPTQTQLTMSE